MEIPPSIENLSHDHDDEESKEKIYESTASTGTVWIREWCHKISQYFFDHSEMKNYFVKFVPCQPRAMKMSEGDFPKKQK